MAGPDIDLLTIERGLVVAPAGCGKTQLIAEALKRHSGGKPILALTHTNAGVVALRARLDKAGVPSASYRLSTIDGWAMRLVSTFPSRSGLDAEVLKLTRRSTDYPAIRRAAALLLKGGHISDLVAASYSRLFVDEYQDCSRYQHAIVYFAASILPTCALGDPLQAIFDFSREDPLADWDKHVCAFFPLAGVLDQPWRWINANSKPLGEWLLDSRRKLLTGEPLDLRTAPEGVSWIQLDGTTADHGKISTAARYTGKGTGDGVLVIGDSKNPKSRHQLASVVPGAIVIEPVDLGDMVDFLLTLDLSTATALDRVLLFAEEVMTGVGAADLKRRLSSIAAGTARKELGTVESTALAFMAAPTPQGVAALLSSISAESGVRTYRPGVLRGAIRALQLAAGTAGLSLHDAAIQVREQFRLLGRPLPKRAIGSTLLLKGLEADGVVILNAHMLNARNLYVAMTRGSSFIAICSTTPILNPAP